MSVRLTDEQLKDIAGELECGLVCFYHIHTGEIETYPHGLDLEFDDFADDWKDVLNKINANINDYIRFDIPPGHVSFGFMSDFVEQIPDRGTRAKFLLAIEKRKPFRQFKDLLHYYPQLHQEWFEYHRLRLLDYTKEIEDQCNSHT